MFWGFLNLLFGLHPSSQTPLARPRVGGAAASHYRIAPRYFLMCRTRLPAERPLRDALFGSSISGRNERFFSSFSLPSFCSRSLAGGSTGFMVAAFVHDVIALSALRQRHHDSHSRARDSGLRKRRGVASLLLATFFTRRVESSGRFTVTLLSPLLFGPVGCAPPIPAFISSQS